MDQLQHLFARMFYGQRRVQDQLPLKSIMKFPFAGRDQQDAHHYANFLLENLCDRVNSTCEPSAQQLFNFSLQTFYKYLTHFERILHVVCLASDHHLAYVCVGASTVGL